MSDANEPVFFLERSQVEDGVYKPLYIPPSMGDECMYRSDLHEPRWERVRVRLNGKTQVMNVLAVTTDKLHDLYLPWSEWEKAQ